MKKILFFLLFTIVAKAQIVSIPNANFKAKLLATSTTAHIAYNASSVRIKIDTNNDGQIQVSEAQQVYILSVSYSNISDLTGIQSFSNLRQLSINGNQLTSLNVSGMVNLSSLYCANNLISSFNFTNLPAISFLDCGYNQLTALNFSGMTLNNLGYLYCNNNAITNLNVSNLSALQVLVCSNNSISSLNVSNLTNLQNLTCSSNSLSTLNTSGLVNLSQFYCQHNQLTSLNFAELQSLYVNCSYNNLTAIDLSVRPNLYIELDCSYNTNLLTINSKDNVVFDETQAPPPAPPGLHSEINFQGTPNLQSICGDSEELVYLQNKKNISGYTNPNCQISATCPFTTNSTTISTCISYTWPINNQVYTTTGIYKVVTGFHTEQLNLTINPICASVVNLRLNIESFYDIGAHAMRNVNTNQGIRTSITNVDDITVELRNPVTTALIATTTAMLQINGIATATFTPDVSGSYYVVVKHKNVIQTWSATPQTIGAVALTYDFTTSANKAYGSNMKQVEPGVWAFYSGDINQDEAIDNSDTDNFFPDIENSNFGVLATDLNGDGAVDNSDTDAFFINVGNSVFSNHP